MRAALALPRRCCPAAPVRRAGAYDPFEASNRVMYAINEPLDKYFAQADRAGVGRLRAQPSSRRRRATSSTTSTICSRGSTGCCRASSDKAGNDFGRVMINTGFGFLGLIDIASDAGIPTRQRGFRPDVRLLGHSAGAVPVHPAVGPSTVRDGTGVIILRYWYTPTQLIPRRCRSAT